MNCREPSVGVVILNCNGLNDTVECIRSLFKVEYSNLVTIVVNNGYSYDAIKLENIFGSKISIIRLPRNLGVGSGFNAGIRYAMNMHVNFVLMLHNDVIVSKNFLRPLVRALLNCPKAGIAGPKVYFYSEPNRIWHAGHYFNRWRGTFSFRGAGELDCGQFDNIHDVDIVMLTCMLVSRDVIKSIGMLEEGFFTGGEEDDFCLRAGEKAFRVVYVGSSAVYHKVGGTTGKIKRAKSYTLTYNAVRSYFEILNHCNRAQRVSSILYRLVTFPKSFPEPLRAASFGLTLKGYLLAMKDILTHRVRWAN
jgi:GT2 family glycosyltransferase